MTEAATPRPVFAPRPAPPIAATCLALLAVCAAFSACESAGPRKGPPLAFDPGPAGRLAGMAWLAGQWRGQSPRGIWECSYSTPEGGVIVGSSKEYIGVEVGAFEFESFRESDGDVVYRPQPGGKPGASFRLTDLDSKRRRAVFENPEHDFPQRVVFWLAGDDTLRISVTAPGEEPDTTRGFELVLART